MNSQPEKSNLHIPINWTLRAFGISLSLEEGVKWLRKKYPANTLEMKKLSQQAKSHICTEIWTRLAGKSIAQCTILPNYVCICCVVHSCWETCSGLWSRPFDFWGGCGGWFQKKNFLETDFKRKQFLQGNTSKKIPTLKIKIFHSV